MQQESAQREIHIIFAHPADLHIHFNKSFITQEAYWILP